MITNSKSAKHLYGRGWLGLIPLIGAFVGIGLIVLGIFKYKDKKLIIIGIADLFFTVIVYSFLMYFTMFSESARKNTATFSLHIMNDLVKDIEFYKLKNGSYPDSIEQLKSDKFIFINDPLRLMPGQSKNKKFNYRKTGDKYILFSSGIDGISGTKDDIYPTESLNNISKPDSILY